MPPRKRAEPTPELPGPDTPDGPPPVAPDEGVAHISTAMMRQLHGLLRNHGITTDTAVHEYLSLHLGRDLESRRTITAVEAAALIRDLETAPRISDVPASLAALRAPFPDEAVGKLPRSICRNCSQSQSKRCDQHQWVSRCSECGNSHSSATMHIDFVGHADLTDRLLTVDPEWTWAPMGRDQFGLPALDRDGNLWINLTVCGITRPGVGDASNGKGAKELIGDALRNAAMRFGCALELWVKGDRAWAHTVDETPEPSEPRASVQLADGRTRTVDDGPVYQADEYDEMGTAELLNAIGDFADKAGKQFGDFTAKWRNDNGGMTVEQMDDLPPEALRPWVRKIRDFMAQVPA